MEQYKVEQNDAAYRMNECASPWMIKPAHGEKNEKNDETKC